MMIKTNITKILKKIEKKGEYFVNKEKNKYQPYCSSLIQGYKRNGVAHQEYLNKIVQCSKRPCLKNEKGKVFNNEIKIKCSKFPDNLVENDEKNDLLDACFLKFNKNLVISYDNFHPINNYYENDEINFDNNNNIKEKNLKNKVKNIKMKKNVKKKKNVKNENVKNKNVKNKEIKNKKIKIALGFPATSRGIKQPSVKNIPFFKVLLPSILNTIQKNSQKFEYHLYLGFDTFDEFYDDNINQRRIFKKFNDLITGYKNVFLKFIKCNYSV
jgi:hypothetical protein